MRTRRLALLCTVGTLVAHVACSSWRAEGIDPATLPPDVQSDYVLFAQKCSKCHSLARPLSSGIDDDAYWQMYVTRMRRQPGSGISVEDTVPILRFLHFYSMEQKRKKRASEQATDPTPAPTTPGPASGPAPVTPPATPPSGAPAAPPAPPPAVPPVSSGVPGAR